MNTPWQHPLLTISEELREKLKQIHLERLQRWPKRPHKKSYEQISNELLHLNSSGIQLNNGAIQLARDVNVEDIFEYTQQLIPWKKGPFMLGAKDPLTINAEWRCDLKWQRLQSIESLFKDKTVLDIGCNNGYYLYRLALAGARLALGIDPIHHVYAQWLFLQHFARVENVSMGLWGVQELPLFEKAFDCILSMGIIYHHKDPIEQLNHIRRALRPGGFVVLESIGIDSAESLALFPPDRYAQMSNIWFVPTISCMENWCLKAKFSRVERLSSIRLTSEEQRVTEWSGPVSLADFLDQNDKNKTVEGHPAPFRHLLIAWV
jgi:tRNA (mo5U34)-methyltransferase